MDLNEIERIIQQTLEKAKAEIASNIYRYGLNASGMTAGTMTVEMRTAGGTLTGRQAFGTLETGRRPGKVPANMTEIITKWAKEKGITPIQRPYIRKPSARWQPKYSVAERSMAYFASAVASKIAREGTALFRAGGQPVVYTPVIDKIIADATQEIILTVGKYIKV